MCLSEVLNAHLKNREKITGDELKSLKRLFLSHTMPALKTEENERSVFELLTAAINLCYGSPNSVPDILDIAYAKKMFSSKVLQIKINGRVCWLSMLNDIGTHQPKTQNDKVSSGAVFADWNQVNPPQSTVTSLNSPNGKALSGAGTAANNSHYRLLSFTFSMKQQTLGLIEWIALRDPLVESFFLSLDMSPDTWKLLVNGCSEVLKTNNQTFLDRQLKQIYLPYPDATGDERFILVTPVPSTRVISSYEIHRKSMWEQGIVLPTHITKVGGKNFQNAGSLPNELGGWLRHLNMGFKTTSIKGSKKLLYRLGKGNLFMIRKNSAALRGLIKVLELDWNQPTVNRQSMIKSVRLRIDELFRPQLDSLAELSTFVSSKFNYTKNKSMLDHEKYSAIPGPLKSILDINIRPVLSLIEKRMYLKNQALNTLTAVSDDCDDSQLRLISEALDNLIGEVWYA